MAARAADQARATMKSLEIFPYPENFELWYAYHVGADPDLSRALAPVLANPDAFDPEAYDRIKQSYLGEGERAVFEAASKGVEGAISSTIRSIESAADDAEAYGAKLTDFGGHLENEDPASLQARVFQLTSETREMVQRNRAMAAELEKSRQQIDQLSGSLEDARRASRTDGLTRLANRRAFDDSMEAAMSEAVDQGEPLTLLVIDIDHFKRFNDTYGHRIGDEVLKIVGQVLRTGVRAQDLPARYGGEEFCVLLPATAAGEAFEVAENVRRAVGKKSLKNARTGESYGRISISIGCSEMTDADTPASFFERADAALYRAKDAGRDRTCVDGAPEAAQAVG